MKDYKKTEAKYKKIGYERIEILFNEANNVFKKDHDLAKKYVRLARKIAMRLKLRLPKEIKRKFCKKCNSYLKSGVNCKIRTKDKMIVCKCFNCGNIMRIPFTKERKNN